MDGGTNGVIATNLTAFYKDTNFKQFYDSHADLYATVETEMDDILHNKMNYKWFDEFYGQPADNNFKIVISMTNGCNNYGAKTIYKDETTNLYAIIGVCRTDSIGSPTLPVRSTIELTSA